MPELILAEKPVYLNSVEREILLYDLHCRLNDLLNYVTLAKAHLSAMPENWVRLRASTLRTLIAKLEEETK
jgi:hypothetical protein